MIRKIIKIDENKCNGCGLCVNACHEGAIELIDGKARLTREDYCDGLGDCLPACPVDAISFEEREAPAYNESAVNEAKKQRASAARHCACPGTQSGSIRREPPAFSAPTKAPGNTSQLRQWPVQLKLVPIKAPFFDGADLLIAADCTAYAYGNFHEDFMRDHVTIIACPKLDNVNYTEKLTAIIGGNDIKSVTVARMEVPCCGGIELAVRNALKASGKIIPCKVVTISGSGNIVG